MTTPRRDPLPNADKGFYVSYARFGLQLWRMRYEERVLVEAYPEYRNYAATTARLLPGIY